MKELNDFTELLQKFLDEEASPAEVQRLFQWLHSSPEARQALANQMDEEAAAKMTALAENADTRSVQSEELGFDPVISSRMEQNIFSRIQTEIQPAENLAAQQTTIGFPWRTYLWRVAAVILLAVGIGYSTFRLSAFRPQAEVKYVTYVTGKHQMATLEMPDGSIIRMNRHSKVQYPENFATQPKREVRLEGEAFFEVAKNPKKPFVIVTRQATIQVLGTSFNVHENQHDTTTVVAVREGRVSFKARQDSLSKGIVLGKGEVGALYQSAFKQTRTHDIANYLSWYNRRLLFNNTPLSEVVQELSSIYDTPIQIKNPALGKRLFTANMKRASLIQVLDQLVLSLQIRYVKKGNTIIIYQP